MSGNGMATAPEKVFTSVNKSMMDLDIINGSLNAVQNVGSNPATNSNNGMSFKDQSDFLKNWYSLDAGNVCNFKA